MVKVVFEGNTYDLREDETLLDGLVARGAPVPFGCRSGTCQSCLLQCLEGEPPAASQKGLRESLRLSRHFLACQCRPWPGMRVALPNSAETRHKAVVHQLKRLNPEIMAVSLRTETEIDYQAGQFIRLSNPEGIDRSYSLASTRTLDPYLVLHVRWYRNGAVSHWIHQELQTGDEVSISNPAGDCFYVPGKPDQPLLLIGTGSGLAPLYGILREALYLGHAGRIDLFHGARTVEGLYLQEELRALEAWHPRFKYHACVSDTGGPLPEGVLRGRASDIALLEHPNLKGWRVYLCGNPEMVRSTQMQTFLAGATLDDIHADPFDSQSDRPPSEGANQADKAPA